MKHTGLTTILLLTVLCLMGSAAAAGTWYVNGVSGSNSNTCTSSTTACETIGHAISLAASGDSIRVAAARYTEHLTIGISLKILGSGAKTTILDGGSAGRVIFVSSATAQVTLSGVTITNGNFLRGAGITNNGGLMLLQSAVSGNRVQLSCSACSTSGGGILNAAGAILMIGNSTVSGNHVSLSGCSHNCSAKGGGISNHGTLVLYNSTISGNTASPLGQGQGSGIYSDGTAIIRNSTLGRNGGSGAATIWGAAALQNSIVANNGSSNCGGAVTSNGYNLSSDATCNFTSTGDLNNTDPMLGPLHYNGGSTQTMALPSGSPAVDAGNPTGCRDGLGHLLKTDQRGEPRPDAEETAGCDMGAYEYQAQGGHCVWVCGSTRCGMLTGYCAGSVNGACRRTYDPVHCPVGRPAGGSGSSCGETIDTTRTCRP